MASAYADGEGVAVPEQSPVVGAELTTGAAVGEGLHDQTGFGDPCAARITSARALLVCAHHVHMHVNTRDRAMGESNRLTALDALMVVRRSRFSSKISKVPIGSCDTPRITVDAGSGFKRCKFLELAGQCSNDGVIRRLFLDLRMSVHQQYGASDGLGDAAAQTRQASSLANTTCGPRRMKRVRRNDESHNDAAWIAVGAFYAEVQMHAHACPPGQLTIFFRPRMGAPVKPGGKLARS